MRDDDDLTLRANDVITSRFSTGLVVREKFMASKIIRGGCTNYPQHHLVHVNQWALPATATKRFG